MLFLSFSPYQKIQESIISTKMKSVCTEEKYSWEGGYNSIISCLFLSGHRSQEFFPGSAQEGADTKEVTYFPPHLSNMMQDHELLAEAL